MASCEPRAIGGLRGDRSGVLTRSSTGSGSWIGTPGLPVVAVYGLTYDTAGRTLYAATHGRSVWKFATGVVASTVTATHTPEPSTYGTASALKVTVSGSSGTPSATGVTLGVP